MSCPTFFVDNLLANLFFLYLFVLEQVSAKIYYFVLMTIGLLIKPAGMSSMQSQGWAHASLGDGLIQSQDFFPVHSSAIKFTSGLLIVAVMLSAAAVFAKMLEKHEVEKPVLWRSARKPKKETKDRFW